MYLSISNKRQKPISRHYNTHNHLANHLREISMYIDSILIGLHSFALLLVLLLLLPHQSINRLLDKTHHLSKSSKEVVHTEGPALDADTIRFVSASSQLTNEG